MINNQTNETKLTMKDQIFQFLVSQTNQVGGKTQACLVKIAEKLALESSTLFKESKDETELAQKMLMELKDRHELFIGVLAVRLGMPAESIPFPEATKDLKTLNKQTMKIVGTLIVNHLTNIAKLHMKRHQSNPKVKPIIAAISATAKYLITLYDEDISSLEHDIENLTAAKVAAAV